MYPKQPGVFFIAHLFFGDLLNYHDPFSAQLFKSFPYTYPTPQTNPLQPLLYTWRIIPVSKLLVTLIDKPFRPFGRGTALLRGLTSHVYYPLTSWDNPPSKPTSAAFTLKLASLV